MIPKLPPFDRRGRIRQEGGTAGSRRVFFPRPLAVAAFLIVLLTAGEAFARLGCGQSFGGGGGGGGGGGTGGGGGEGLIWLIYFLIRLCISHPHIGIPLTIVVVLGVVLYAKYGKPVRSVGSYSSSGRSRRKRSGGIRLDRLRENDPNFSRPLFLDFVQILYSRAHHARGTRELDPLGPYFLGPALAQLKSGEGDRALSSVDSVIVGRSDIVQVQVYPKRTNFITVEFEANYTEVRGDASIDFYTIERWTFRRDAGVLSKGPEEMRTLSCPGCGSPVELKTDGSCTYCG
ncbi:MAG: hypothetical protein ACYTFG_13835, partial [Planctomycetota bacterium]